MARKVGRTTHDSLSISFEHLNACYVSCITVFEGRGGMLVSK